MCWFTKPKLVGPLSAHRPQRIWAEDELVMDGSARSPNRSFRISPVDRLGRTISSLVLDAAEAIARRAIEHAEKLLIDPAVAATLLEESAATVSRAINSKSHCTQDEVRDLPSYLFRAFIRRVNRAKRRQFFQEDAVRMLSSDSDKSTDAYEHLELKILVDELLASSDAVTRDMFYRRAQGFSWKEIGFAYGVSGHAAESRFSQALRRIGARLGTKK
jgi:DNA-directed RNA polymerase specialized sigma24 family protein